MITSRQSMFVRWFIITSLLLVILAVIFVLTTHPLVVTIAGAEGIVYLLLFILTLLIYGWFALFRTRAATAEERIALQQGTLWGIVCGAAWVIELLLANLPGLQAGPLFRILYEGTALAGFLLPVVASLLAAWRARRIVAGLQAGLLCGMFGGLMIFLASIIFSSVLFKAGLSDPQTIAEFRRSGLPDIMTYIVSDYLAGMIAHLWIGLITGLFLGIVGGAVGKALSQPEKATREEKRLNARMP